jgi:multidrug efflux pump subunit AcrA (membrane-fusion protein)
MKTRDIYLKILKKNWLPAIFLSILIIIQVSCNSNATDKYSVIKGHFRQSVIETGELQAVNASFLSMPRINYIYGYSFKIIGLADYGKNVHKGEAVVTVDPSSVQKFIIEKNEALENEIASTNKLKAQITNNLQELKAQLRNEQASYDIKKLEVGKSGFESAGIKKVIALEFRQSEIKLRKIMRNLELKPRLDSLDLRIQQIKVAQKENEVKAAQYDLAKMVVTSPLDGIFVVEENWRTGQAIRVGDEVYLGAPVAKIPDIRSMKVKGFIMENDIRRIKEGLDVIVRLDALPAVPFHGKILSLSKVCVDRDEKKVFRTEVLITESDLRLKPGMTVSCEYITYDGDNEIYVPSNCIVEENKHFYVFTMKRGKLRKTEIKTGPSNNMYTVVSGDLKPGQALELPENVITR